ncbi:saccharopine dehydrogenase NADP-binding domain-containing protein [Pseudonocardia lacus]|uniref:saccharopine dehydrogenase NADP-binding domain-containing protein n=1 Tax=Pseudonocardia lacus TaxID=2835865 RepID=UPI001BDC4A1E|nr:saccharopine dehydrogenase NADP-binding domain-containing protein [Pseudonocardia lacus]
MDGIWILGGAGRTGRAIAAELVARGAPAPVLVGRDPGRLREVAGKVGGTPLVAGSVEAICAELIRRRPAVVVNTIGPFTETALPVARACPPGTHYLDLSNELPAVTALLGLHDEAVATDRCIVPAAGFGVLGTESVVLALCADRPAPRRVRVDAVPVLGGEPGPVGVALAATIVGALAAGGRHYADGRLTRTRPGGAAERLTLPDGSTVSTAGGPTADLEAAHRASGAPFVVAASTYTASGPLVRAVLPAVGALMAVPPLRRAAVRALSRVRVTPKPPARESTWAHARVEWADGTVREGWMRAGEAMAFTAGVAAEVALRLSRGEGRPGASTPGAMFGPELVDAAGGTLLLDVGAT